MFRKILIITFLIVGLIFFLKEYEPFHSNNYYDEEIENLEISLIEKKDISTERGDSFTDTVINSNEMKNNVQVVDVAEWVELISSVKTYDWIFSKMRVDPLLVNLRKKYEKNPFGILLTKLIDLKKGQLVQIGFPKNLLNDNQLDDEDNKTIFYYDGKVVDLNIFESITDKPICAVTFSGRDLYKYSKDHIYFYVDGIEYPINNGVDYAGVRILSRQIGDSNAYLNVKKIECFLGGAFKSDYQNLNISHLYITLGYSPTIF